MESWLEKKEANISNGIESFNNILVTHDLQDCIDESLDLSFIKVYEQLPIINYTRYNEKENPSDSTYLGKLNPSDENAG